MRGIIIAVAVWGIVLSRLGCGIQTVLPFVFTAWQFWQKPPHWQPFYAAAADAGSSFWADPGFSATGSATGAETGAGSAGVPAGLDASIGAAP